MGRRHQETRWIDRWSRRLIAGIAAVGASETAYLTLTKLLGESAACPTEGCDLALNSPYATVLGLPLTLFGFLGYVTMLGLAITPLFVNPDSHKERYQKLDEGTWPLLYILALAMVVFSGYLMYVLAVELKALCLYCIASALFTLSMLLLTLMGRRWEDTGQLLFTGLIVAVITLTGTLALYAPVQGTARTLAARSGEVGPPVTSLSGQAEIALAEHLNAIGAKMYGAWWCPHCHDQKELFGAEAAALLPYVECSPDGQHSQTNLCRSKTQVTGFPTWEIKGEYYPGSRSLETLADVSGYSGPTSFKAKAKAS